MYDIAYVNFGWCKALHQAFAFWVTYFTAKGYREIHTSYRLINIRRTYSIISYLSHNIMPNFLEFTSLEHKFPQMLVKNVFNTRFCSVQHKISILYQRKVCSHSIVRLLLLLLELSISIQVLLLQFLQW